MIALANQIQPDLTIVGPELPLMLGVVDEFTRRGWRTFGPTRAAAQLETSKSFAKEFLQRHRIPTAHYAICDSPQQVRDALPHFHTPIVVKADGLAAGKGVVIAKSKDEAATVAHEMLSGRMLGEAGSRVVLEEFLQGDELSFLVVSDGERVAPLVAAQDHKRVGDGDTGPNTGGMGAYTTPTIVDDQMRDWLVAHIARPVVAGMKAEGAEYKGVLYCGLMMTARGPMVLEFNCRFGDPETQPISDAPRKRPGRGDGGLHRRPHQRRRFQMVERCGGMRGDGFGRLSGKLRGGQEDHRTGRSGETGRRKSLPCRHLET